MNEIKWVVLASNFPQTFKPLFWKGTCSDIHAYHGWPNIPGWLRGEQGEGYCTLQKGEGIRRCSVGKSTSTCFAITTSLLHLYDICRHKSVLIQVCNISDSWLAFVLHLWICRDVFYECRATASFRWRYVIMRVITVDDVRDQIDVFFLCSFIHILRHQCLIRPL